MTASDCLFRLLSKSVITEQQCEDLKRARYTKEAWSRVANNIRKSTQKYHKLLDVLEYFEMSRIVSMLETTFGPCPDCGKIVSRNKDGSLNKGHKCKDTGSDIEEYYEEEELSDTGSDTEEYEEELSDNPLTCELNIEDDFFDVHEYLLDAKVKWFCIGMGLRVKIEDLDAIEATKENVDDRLREMIKIWLKKGTNKSWQTVIDVLETKSVGRPDVAETIRQSLDEELL